MTAELFALCFDANDPERLARFWAEILGREVGEDLSLDPVHDPGLRIRFRPSAAVKNGPNKMHFDLTSTSPEDQQAKVDRAITAGARRLDIGQGPDALHVVLADPEGNEFDVIEPGNRFLAGTDLIGAVSSDGTQELGYFWSAALGWPLVWDQNQETAIQSPRGGTKITWGGPPLNPRSGREPHFDLVAPPEEVARLVSLGATRTGTGAPDGVVLMTDPDGNDFCVLTGGHAA
ncbi:VOC family protein [Actinoplanes sp. NPDC049265]|uniref:VOC family protein n=1 Tax=Actinoplanes sp. NPDC049265 TaxID=3363902 RepID=UPI00371C47CF